MSMSDKEEEFVKIPFLASRKNLDEYVINPAPNHQILLCPTFWTKILLVIFYIPAIILYGLSYMNLSKLGQPHSEHQCQLGLLEIPSPVLKSTSINFEIRKFSQDFRESEFAGDPSPELDLAWHALFEDNNIRVGKEDLEILGVQSVELADGGFVAQLGVFHELHCLKKVRHWIFKDYYVFPKNLTESELEEWPAHINHCLEMLRQKIMCRGDTSLSTFTWIGDENHRVPTPWDLGPHRCINWDTLTAWTRERSVDIYDKGMLIDERGELFP